MVEDEIEDDYDLVEILREGRRKRKMKRKRKREKVDDDVNAK